MRSVAVLFVISMSLAGCFDDEVRPTRDTFSESILWSQPPEVVVEMHHVAGREPSQYAIDRMREELEAQTNKQTITILDSVEIHVPDDSQEKVWEAAELSRLHEDTFVGIGPNQLYKDDEKVVIHMMFLNGVGKLGEDRFFIGLQTVPTLYILPDSTDDLVNTGRSTSLPYTQVDSPTEMEHVDQAEAAIVVHELGHAFGLVGLDAAMLESRLPSEEDDPCQCHSNNQDSVMFPGTESFNAERYVEEERFVADTFDANDLADLAALREQDPYDK